MNNETMSAKERRERADAYRAKRIREAYEGVMIPQYRVHADAETGEWLEAPEYVGEVDRKEWLLKSDTNRVHYDEYEALTGNGEEMETRAIEVIWVD